MSSASVAPVATRLEKMRIRKIFTKCHYVTPTSGPRGTRIRHRGNHLRGSLRRRNHPHDHRRRARVLRGSRSSELRRQARQRAPSWFGSHNAFSVFLPRCQLHRCSSLLSSGLNLQELPIPPMGLCHLLGVSNHNLEPERPAGAAVDCSPLP